MKNDTVFSFEIAFDPHHADAIIKTNMPDDSIWSRIYLLCSTVSDNIEEESKSKFRIPWFEFRCILFELANYVKKENINVFYDEYSRKLLMNYFNDIIALQEVKNKKEQKDIDIVNLLSKTKFKRKLTKQQIRDAIKLIALKHGANFSVPGAGKTTTLLAVHSILKKMDIVTNLLVVAPRNAFISWEDEMIACFEKSSPSVTRLIGGIKNISILLRKNPEISLINYHQLPIVVDEIKGFLQRNRVHLVLDESHRIKRGLPGIHYSAVIKIADMAYRRDIMSGTPMPQSTSDLVSQFDFLWPGGDVFEEAMSNNDELKRIQMVNHIIRPLYVRTTKSELGLTPPKIKFTKIKLGPIQRELYDLLRSEIARLISGMDKDDIIAFRRLGKHVVRLLQIASNPMLISATDYEEENSPILPGTTKWQLLTEFSRYEKAAKIQYLIKRIRELTDKNEKVVIWSVFVQNIELLERILSDLGAVSIYGDIETGDENESYTREGRIRRFHEDPNCKVMIANPAACGEGISLHKICHNALYLDRTFNAAHYLQSVDRIHRLGLPSNITTNVEILLAEDTIDETVVTRLGNKIAAMSAVLEDADLRTLAYDPEDIIGDVPGGIDKEDFNEIKKHLEGKT